MEHKDTYGACLYVSSSSYSLSQLSELIGLKPDEAQEMGKPKKFASNKKYEKNLWVYDSRYHIDKNADIDKHLSYLMHVITELSPNAKSVLKKMEPVIGLRGYVYSCNPGASVGRDALRIIAQINGEIDFDFFAVGPDPDE